MSKQIAYEQVEQLAKAIADQTAFEWFGSDGWGEVKEVEYDTEYDPEEDGDFVELGFRISWSTQDNYHESHMDYIQFHSAKDFWDEYGFYFKEKQDE
jgi:hypothetical protein